MIRPQFALTGVLALSVVWGLSGCGGGGGGGGTKPSSPSVTEETQPAKPSTGDSAKTEGKKADATAPAGEEGWGTLKGQIVFAGTPPAPKIIVKQGDQNAKDAAVCAVEDIVSEELVVNKDNNGLKWVIVYLGGKPKIHPDLKDPEGRVELGQKHCHFIPHVTAIRQGQQFIIASDDPIAHNTKGDGFKNPGFNPTVPPAIDKRSELEGPDLLAENLPINISCGIHPWMKAYLGVYAHPYFAVTDGDGEFKIEKVPAGEQPFIIWHELGYGEGGKTGKPIMVKAGETTDLGQIKYAPKP